MLPTTFLAYVPPPVPRPQDQPIPNPFLHERNNIQASMDNSKQWQSKLKFKLSEFKSDYGTDEVLDWI